MTDRPMRNGGYVMGLATPMTDELKPCPFCGSDAELTHDSDHHGEWFNLGCSRHWKAVDPDEACPLGLLWYTEDPANEAKAIRLWNTRTQGLPRPEYLHDWTKVIEGHRQEYYEGMNDLVVVTRQAASLGASALRELNAEDFYHNNGAAMNELSDASGAG